MTTLPEEIIAATTSDLEDQTQRLRSLDLSDPTIAEVVRRSYEVLSGSGPLWLVKYHPAMDAVPLDLVLSGQADCVLNVLGRIEHGIPV